MKLGISVLVAVTPALSPTVFAGDYNVLAVEGYPNICRTKSHMRSIPRLAPNLFNPSQNVRQNVIHTII